MPQLEVLYLALPIMGTVGLTDQPPPGFPFLLGNFIDFLFLVLLIGKLRHKEIKRINFLHTPSSGN